MFIRGLNLFIFVYLLLQVYGDEYPTIVKDKLSSTYRLLAEDPSSTASGNPGEGKSGSSSSSSDKPSGIKRKKNGNFTEYKMGEAAKSLSRFEYIAIIGGIGFFLFMGAAFS
jgi:hypothetical protein